jgi:hypothetical protein
MSWLRKLLTAVNFIASRKAKVERAAQELADVGAVFEKFAAQVDEAKRIAKTLKVVLSDLHSNNVLRSDSVQHLRDAASLLDTVIEVGTDGICESKEAWAAIQELVPAQYRK